jgi:hypothetical protein
MTTTRHHTAARRRALMRDGTALRFPPRRAVRAYGGRAWPGRSHPGPYPPPARGGTRRRRRTLRGAYRLLTRVPPSQTYRFGPLPDLPPASFGMTRRCKSREH